jgi:hypothetical protein
MKAYQFSPTLFQNIHTTSGNHKNSYWKGTGGVLFVVKRSEFKEIYLHVVLN